MSRERRRSEERQIGRSADLLIDYRSMRQNVKDAEYEGKEGSGKSTE
jgi:hypothetical protein